MAHKLIINYKDVYKVVEIKDTIYFCKKTPLGTWQMDKVLDVSLESIFECGREEMLIVLMRFYKDLFLGRINGVGTDSGYMCPKTKELSLESKYDGSMKVVFEDTGEYYTEYGELINLEEYL